MNTDCGNISISQGNIAYSCSRYESWTLPAQDIAVVGECSNENGPHLEDHFWALVPLDLNWVLFPSEAAGEDAVMTQLGARLGVEFAPRLMFAARFASRVLWPTEMLGQNLVSFHQEDRSRKERILRFWEADPVRMALADNVVDYVKQLSHRSGG